MSLIDSGEADSREEEVASTFIQHWDGSPYDPTVADGLLLRILELTLDLCIDYVLETALAARVPQEKPVLAGRQPAPERALFQGAVSP
jgi:hypothetical protein